MKKIKDFQKMLKIKRARFGDNFDDSELEKKFIRFYETGQRIKVESLDGGTKTGTVGMTTGYKPVFLLMLRSNSYGSSYLLTDREKIIAEKIGRQYHVYCDTWFDLKHGQTVRYKSLSNNFRSWYHDRITGCITTHRIENNLIIEDCEGE